MVVVISEFGQHENIYVVNIGFVITYTNKNGNKFQGNMDMEISTAEKIMLAYINNSIPTYHLSNKKTNKVAKH
jgi:hypothetical protein